VLQAGPHVLRRALFLAFIVVIAAAFGCALDRASPASDDSTDADIAEPQEEATDDELSTVQIALPFPADKLKQTWAVSHDKTLLLCRWQEDREYDVTYYLVSAKPVVGAANHPQVQHICPTSIEFLCHSEGGIPFESFPYVIVYDIEAEDWTRRDVWRDPCDALQFGGCPVEGQELTDIWIESGAVSLQFRTVPEAMPDLGGPFDRIPQTLAEWDAGAEALVLHFHGTRLAEGLTEQVEPRTMTVRFKTMSKE